MKKGFTLIELLAVIVILAIIAVIAVPIVLNIIDETKDNAQLRSAEMYLKGLETSIATSTINNKKISDDTYSIMANGNVCLEYDDEVRCINELVVKMNGETPIGGIVTIEKGKIKDIELIYSNKKTIIYNSKKELVFKVVEEEIEYIKVTLEKGENFNSKIKTLANNGETVAHTNDDTNVTSIEFYSNGKLPKGYTKAKLNNLSNKVDVSLNKDESIMAYYEEGKVYVVSDNLISLNSDSGHMFYRLKSVTSIVFINENYNMVDTSQVTNMYSMFSYCSSLTALDVSNFDTSQVTNMSSIFSSCISLTALDVSNWNTSQVTNMSSMFNTCLKLTALDVSHFDTSQVTYMTYMFYGCSKLTALDVSNFDTSQVTNMTSMFSGCGKLTALDVSNWNTSQVTNMEKMFYNCSSLTALDVSHFDTSQVTIMSSMFRKTKNLNEIIIGCDWVTAPTTDYMFDSSGYTLDKLNAQIEEIKPTCPVVNAN